MSVATHRKIFPTLKIESNFNI